jgi:hypothetical protein
VTAGGGIPVNMYLMMYAAGGALLAFLLFLLAVRHSRTSSDLGPLSEQWLSDQKRQGEPSSR